MAEVWQIARPTRTCARSGEGIPPETPYYSALVDGDNGFERHDFSSESWPDINREQLFSYWKNKGYFPRSSKKPTVDFDRLLEFFDALENAEDREKRLLRYVIALVLTRRRRLRLDDMSRTDQGDRLVLFDRRGEGKTVEVIAPEASRGDLEAAQAKLNELFECDLQGE